MKKIVYQYLPYDPCVSEILELAFEALSEDTSPMLDAWIYTVNALLLETPSKPRRLIVTIRPSTLPFWKGILSRFAAERILYLLPTALSSSTVDAHRILELLFYDERMVPLEVRLNRLRGGTFVEHVVQVCFIDFASEVSSRRYESGDPLVKQIFCTFE